MDGTWRNDKGEVERLTSILAWINGHTTRLGLGPHVASSSASSARIGVITGHAFASHAPEGQLFVSMFVEPRLSTCWLGDAAGYCPINSALDSVCYVYVILRTLVKLTKSELEVRLIFGLQNF